MSVYKSPKSRYWQYDFQYQGTRFHGSTGVETRAKAEKVEQRKREEAALGIRRDGLTLDEAAGLWWAQKGQHRKKPATIERRVNILLRLLGKDTLIRDITTRVIAKAIERRRGETYSKAKGKNARRYSLSNATVNLDIVGTLRPILSRAEKVWEEPGLRRINWQDLVLPESPPRIQYYTDGQQTAWLDECDDAARMPLQILLTYGLRFSEVFFPPAAFDPSGPRLVLQKRKKDPHVIPLRADDARQIAARVGRAKAAGLETIWFEQDARGDLVPLTYYGLQARLRSAGKRAGLTMGRIIHGARHHAGTSTLRRTGNLKTAQQLLGHKDIKSTLIYAHALEADLRAAVEGESRNIPGAATEADEFVIPKQRRRRGRASSS